MELDNGFVLIRPYYFINLDSVNREFLSDGSILSGDIASVVKSLREPPKAEVYLELSRKCLDILNKNDFKYKTFPELSLHAILEWYGNNDNEISNEGIGDSDVNAVDYWLFSPGEYANKWDEFYNEGIMAIGWPMGDLKQFKSKKEIYPALKKLYNDNINHFNDANCL